MKRGWCPNLYDPMPAGDGLLVRVKPRGARITAVALRLLAHPAARLGNGAVELTRRANFQVRGLSHAGAEEFATAMVAAGLASADPGAERRRNVLTAPLAGDDPSCANDASVLASALETMLEADAWLPAPAAKFAIAVDGGGVLPLVVDADIHVRSDGARHWIRAGDACVSCEPDATVAVVRQLVHDAGGRRMRAAFPIAAASPPAGFLPYPNTERGAFAIGLPFGQTDATTLGLLADISEQFGDGTLRTSPWRALLLGSIRAVDAAAISTAAAGLVVTTDDRRLRMAACIGSAGCASGTVPARADAAALADAGWTGFLHLSGCSKGCAHSGAAEVTLVGRDGRYDLVRDGRADARPAATGLSLAQVRAWLGTA